MVAAGSSTSCRNHSTMAYRYTSHDEIDFERFPSGIFFNAQQFQQADTFAHTTDTNQGETSLFPRFREAENASSRLIRCLPLLSISVDVDVNSTISRTTLTQIFSNISNVCIKEANYTFPLYDGAAVVSFRCFVGDDKVLEGRVKPKAEANAEYIKAVADQRVAALLEEHTPEVFETHLGSIPPKTSVKIEIVYINELNADVAGEGVLVTIPTSVAPRYGTPPNSLSESTDTGIAGDHIKKGLKIKVDVTATVPINKLESRTHPISVEMGISGTLALATDFGDLDHPPEPVGFDPRKACAMLSDRSAMLGKDFVLLILASGTSLLQSRALVETALDQIGESAMMVTLNPRDLFPSPTLVGDFNGEIIFIADRSGSMGGSKMSTLRDAMTVFLKSLPKECHLNIYSFGSNYSSLWEKSRQYSQETLDAAIHHVSTTFGANMGGTEILPVLKRVVEQRLNHKNFTTQVILLTDGEVWNTEETTDFVGKATGDSAGGLRFFTLGIGYAVSHRLVEGIGRQGGGFGEVVAIDTHGRWEGRVIQMLKGALSPASWKCEITLFEFMESPKKPSTPETTEDLTGPAVSLRLPAYIQAPYSLHSLHPFARSSIFFLFNRDQGPLPRAINVKASTTSGETISVDMPVEHTKTKSPIINHLAAKSAILDLEAGHSWIHAAASRSGLFLGGKLSTPAALDDLARQEAERIGLKWKIAGKWTSFVAVDRDSHTEGLVRLYKPSRYELARLTRPRSFAAGPSSNFNLRLQNGIVDPNTGGENEPPSGLRSGSRWDRGDPSRESCNSTANVSGESIGEQLSSINVVSKIMFGLSAHRRSARSVRLAIPPPPHLNGGTDSPWISPPILSPGPFYNGLYTANASGESIGERPMFSTRRSDIRTSKALTDMVPRPGSPSATEDPMDTSVHWQSSRDKVARGAKKRRRLKNPWEAPTDIEPQPGSPPATEDPIDTSVHWPSLENIAAGEAKERGRLKNSWSLPWLLGKPTKTRHSSNKFTSSVVDMAPKESEAVATTWDAPIKTPISLSVTRHINLMDLFNIQTFEGGFRLSSLAVELRNDLQGHFDFTEFTELEALLSSKSSWTLSAFHGREPSEIGGTFIVISFIRNQFPELKDLWQLVIEKADRWVASFLQDEKDREDVKKWIQEKWH